MTAQDDIAVQKGTGFYTLRRTAATIAAQSGDVFAVQGLLGHTDTKMASVYVQTVSEQTDKAVLALRHWLTQKPPVEKDPCPLSMNAAVASVPRTANYSAKGRDRSHAIGQEREMPGVCSSIRRSDHPALAAKSPPRMLSPLTARPSPGTIISVRPWSNR